ncbi:MAG: hybrid sensor histidine kinase/response regulator [Candidatus Brocadiia bacterium]
MDNRRILIIDDDPAIREDYKRILSPEAIPSLSKIDELERELFKKGSEHSSEDLPQFDLAFASQGRQGYELAVQAIAEEKPFAVAFVDIRMPPGWDGMETASRIRFHDKDIEIVIVTAYSDKDRKSLVAALEDPSKLLYLKKPFDPDEIRQLAHSLTEKWNLQHREREYRKYMESLLDLFSSLRLEAENEQGLLAFLLEKIASFFHATSAVAHYKGIHNLEFVTDYPSELVGPRPDIPNPVPDKVSILPGNLLLIPMKIAGGEAQAILRLPAGKIASANAVVLGGIIGHNVTNIFNGYLFQRQLIEKNSSEAVGNAVYRIIHDINNPLSAIIGFATLIEKGRSPNEKDLRRVRNIISAAENIRRLTDSLHDLISEDIHIVIDSVDLKELVTEVAAGFAEKCMKAEVELVLDIPSVPVLLNVDRERIARCLAELLENSLEAADKSRAQKRVEISLRDDHAAVTIVVKDTGVGIPPEVLPRVWMPFFSYGRKNRLGLGLPLVRKLAALFRGEVDISSETNQGTSVRITFTRS